MRTLVKTIFCSFLFVSCVHAAIPKFTCGPYTAKNQNQSITLDTPSDKGQIFILKNTSNKSVWIDHQTKKPMNAGWSSFLTPQHWSALSLANKKSFSLSCAVIHPGKVEHLNCTKIISVCVPKEVIFNTNIKNKNFWVAEDKKSLDDLVVAIAKRKITIR